MWTPCRWDSAAPRFRSNVSSVDTELSDGKGLIHSRWMALLADRDAQHLRHRRVGLDRCRDPASGRRSGHGERVGNGSVVGDRGAHREHATDAEPGRAGDDLGLRLGVGESSLQGGLLCRRPVGAREGRKPDSRSGRIVGWADAVSCTSWSRCSPVSSSVLATTMAPRITGTTWTEFLRAQGHQPAERDESLEDVGRGREVALGIDIAELLVDEDHAEWPLAHRLVGDVQVAACRVSRLMGRATSGESWAGGPVVGVGHARRSAYPSDDAAEIEADADGPLSAA